MLRFRWFIPPMIRLRGATAAGGLGKCLLHESANGPAGAEQGGGPTAERPPRRLRPGEPRSPRPRPPSLPEHGQKAGTKRRRRGGGGAWTDGRAGMAGTSLPAGAAGAAGAAGRSPAAGRALLLVGPSASGRSALLFRAAAAQAASSSSSSSPSAGRVLFLAPRPLQRLPGRPAAPAAALQRIQFRYPASLRELLQLLASLHETWPGDLSLLLLDSLEEYLAGGPGPQAAAQLAALLLDTADHFSRKGRAEPRGCRLMVSMKLPGEGGEGAEQLSAVQRYFLAQCWLLPETPPGSPGGSGGQGLPQRVRARLSQPGTEDQEWLLRFPPQEEMKIAPLPGPGRKSPPGTETHPVLDLWWA
ncbi:ATPase SWSAP1 [Paroedura picta]|uniref:ATPase SWSAP1 n=1 Tax=Paroedura picta TaxID=143630 RepID=UPI004056FF17